MNEIEMSMRELRAHFAVAQRHVEMKNDRILVTRSGFYVCAFVSLEDFRFLEQRKPRQAPEVERTVEDARAHLADVVAEAEFARRVMLFRRGRRAGAFVSWDDLKLLEKDKPYFEREENARRLAERRAV